MAEYFAARLAAPLPALAGIEFAPERDAFCAAHAPAKIACWPWDQGGYRPEAQARMAWSEAGLHLLLCARERTINAEHARFNEDVWTDSCLECFLQPCPDSDDRYLNVEVNALGAALIGVGKAREGRARLQTPPQGMRFEASRHAGAWWAVAYTIPAAFLRETFGFAPEAGAAMRGNFYKCEEKLQPHFGCWSPIETPKPDFHQPAYFGTIHLIG